MSKPTSLGAAFLIALLAAASGAGSAAATPNRWVADPVHSSANFTATHFGLAHVHGIIPITNAVIVAPQSPQLPASVSATLDATGVDTRNSDRDADLRSPHYFDAARYPAIAFESTAITPVDAKTFNLAGNLTLHGVTRPILLKTTFLGQTVDPRGNERVAYVATASIKRSDFAMTNFPLIVGDNVDIEIDIEAVGR